MTVAGEDKLRHHTTRAYVSVANSAKVFTNEVKNGRGLSEGFVRKTKSQSPHHSLVDNPPTPDHQCASRQLM